MSDRANPSPPSSAAPPTTKRPWWKLHVSTWVVMLLAAVLLTLMIFPARTVLYESPFGDARQETMYEHGWPLMYMVGGGGEIWSWGDSLGFHPWRLIADLLVAAAMIGCIGVTKEFFRRRRTGPWQFSLRTALVVMTVTGVGLGGIVRRNRDEQSAAARIAELGGTIQWSEGAPVWLRDLAGARLTNPFRRVQAIYHAVDFPATDVLHPIGTLAELKPDLLALEHLERLSLTSWRSGRRGKPCQIHGVQEFEAGQEVLESWGLTDSLPVLRELFARFPQLEIHVYWGLERLENPPQTR